MSIETEVTQLKAILIETLAHAASQIGSTRASAKINEVICDLLPNTSVEQIAALEASERVMSANLELIRGNLAAITQIVTEVLPHIEDVDIADDFRKILALAKPIEDEPAA